MSHAAAPEPALEASDHPSPARRWATLMASVMLMIGLLAMLRSGAADWDVRNARELIRWPGHFLTGVAQFTIGVAGIWCARRESVTRGFLTVSGLFLVCWAVAGIILDGDPNDVVTRDAWLVGINLVAGGVSLAFAAWSARRPIPD